MRRDPITPRPHWEQLIEADGCTFSRSVAPDGTLVHYWNESAVYVLSPADVRSLSEQVQFIFDEIFVKGTDVIAALPPEERTALLRKMQIPDFAHAATLASWEREPADQSVYARFDVRYVDGVAQIYEFNAQTPTGLLEAGYVQWKWAEQVKPGSDQWNGLWDGLIAAWGRNLALWGPRLGFDPAAAAPYKPTIHFAYGQGETQGEDEITVSYLADACRAAGYNVRVITVEDILLGDDGRFYVAREGLELRRHQQTNTYSDFDLEHLTVCFSLYPYEWLWTEAFGQAVYADMERGPALDASGAYVGGTVWFEAPYKMIWSNKAILPVLWELYGNDPLRSKHLIPSWFKGQEPADLTDWVEKPIFGREGASVRVIKSGKLVAESPGDYASDDPADYIVQAYAPPPAYPAGAGVVYPVCGVWMMDGEVSGLGMREDAHVVTGTLGQFVPHIVEESPVGTET